MVLNVIALCYIMLQNRRSALIINSSAITSPIQSLARSFSSLISWHDDSRTLPRLVEISFFSVFSFLFFATILFRACYTVKALLCTLCTCETKSYSFDDILQYHNDMPTRTALCHFVCETILKATRNTYCSPVRSMREETVLVAIKFPVIISKAKNIEARLTFLNFVIWAPM